MSDNYGKDPDAMSRPTPEQYRVTQQNGTEPVPTGVRPRPEGTFGPALVGVHGRAWEGDKGKQYRAGFGRTG